MHSLDARSMKLNYDLYLGGLLVNRVYVGVSGLSDKVAKGGRPEVNGKTESPSYKVGA